MPFRKLLKAARHPLSQNAAAMYAAQLTLTFLPLVTLPWLTRALVREEFDSVVFVQGFASLLGVPIGYGFSLSATRMIARQRASPRAMSETVAGVVGAQLMSARS